LAKKKDPSRVKELASILGKTLMQQGPPQKVTSKRSLGDVAEKKLNSLRGMRETKVIKEGGDAKGRIGIMKRPGVWAHNMQVYGAVTSLLDLKKKGREEKKNERSLRHLQIRQ